LPVKNHGLCGQPLASNASAIRILLSASAIARLALAVASSRKLCASVFVLMLFPSFVCSVQAAYRRD
jgi:hypothetical protein